MLFYPRERDVEPSMHLMGFLKRFRRKPCTRSICFIRGLCNKRSPLICSIFCMTSTIFFVDKYTTMYNLKYHSANFWSSYWFFCFLFWFVFVFFLFGFLGGFLWGGGGYDFTIPNIIIWNNSVQKCLLFLAILLYTNLIL